MDAYAHRRAIRGEIVYMHVGSRRFVELHYMNDPIVPVTVRERAEGDTGHVYYGWQRAGETDYRMIWPSEAQFEVCFPNSSKWPEKEGQGRKVWLTIEERSE